jgi:hypothetical protein
VPALAAIDLCAALAFALVYAAAGGRWLGQAAFLASLVVVFAAAAAVWARTERTRGGPRDVLSRVGRAVLALAVVVLGLPALVLAPLVSLERALPPTAGMTDVLRPALILLLICLAWTAAVNVAGAAIVIGAAVRAGLRRRPGHDARSR